MKQFSIPYTKNISKYLINKDKNYFNDIYFSDGLLPSARDIKLSKNERYELKELSTEYDLNYTFNPSYYPIKFYLEENIIKFINQIEILIKFYNLKYITLNNTFLLNVYEFRKILKDYNVKIRISTNNRIDNLEKLKLYHQEFFVDNFVLDRNINRNYDELLKCFYYARKNNIELFLLLNEGCLPNCPYKDFCDNIVSQYYTITIEEKDKISNFHDNFGCILEFKEKPYKSLQSPFISPLALKEYPQLKYKIVGRNKDISILQDIIDAYIYEKGDIDLKKFFATPKFNSNFTFYDLEEYGFSKKVKNCKLECHSCDFCKNLYENLQKGEK